MVEAARSGHFEICRLQLTWPAHPAKAGGSALSCAAGHGSTDICRLLLSWPRHPPRADATESWALAAAAHRGHVYSALFELRPPNASLCMYDRFGIQGAGNVHVEVCRLLLSWPVHPARADQL